MSGLFADRVPRHCESVRVRTTAGDGGEEAVGGRNVKTENRVQRKECYIPMMSQWNIAVSSPAVLFPIYLPSRRPSVRITFGTYVFDVLHVLPYNYFILVIIYYLKSTILIDIMYIDCFPNYICSIIVNFVFFSTI